MAPTPKTIHIEPGGELDRILRESADMPVVLEQRGVRYRLIRIDPFPEDCQTPLADERDVWADYDPERVQRGLRRSHGILREVDREQLKRDLADQRAQDAHGRPS